MPSSPSRPAPAEPSVKATADDMWAGGQIDLWGPPRPPRPASTGRRRFWSRTPKAPIWARDQVGKTWGLPDVVFGFYILLWSNVALAAAAFGYAMLEGFNRNGLLGTSNQQVMVEDLLTEMTRLLSTGPGVLIGGLTMWAAFFIAPWQATRKKGAKSLAIDFGFRFNWRRDLLLGAGFAIALRIVEALVTQLLVTLGVNMSSAGNTAIITNLSGPWLFIDAFVVAAIGAPIFEELFFRGLVFGALLKNFTRDQDGTSPQSAFGRWVSAHLGGAWAGWALFRRFLYRWRLPLSVVISAMMFGILHFQGTNTFGSWFVVGSTASIGVLLAVIRHRTGRLGTTICTHVIFNASGVLLSLFT